MVGETLKRLNARDVVMPSGVAGGAGPMAAQQVIDFFKACTSASTDRDLANVLLVRGVRISTGVETGSYEGQAMTRQYCEFSFPNLGNAQSLAPTPAKFLDDVSLCLLGHTTCSGLRATVEGDGLNVRFFLR